MGDILIIVVTSSLYYNKFSSTTPLMWLSRANFGVADKIHWMKSSDCQLDLASNHLIKHNRLLNHLIKHNKLFRLHTYNGVIWSAIFELSQLKFLQAVQLMNFITLQSKTFQQDGGEKSLCPPISKPPPPITFSVWVLIVYCHKHAMVSIKMART